MSANPTPTPDPLDILNEATAILNQLGQTTILQAVTSAVNRRLSTTYSPHEIARAISEVDPQHGKVRVRNEKGRLYLSLVNDPRFHT
jgi:hypothetical protein